MLSKEICIPRKSITTIRIDRKLNLVLSRTALTTEYQPPSNRPWRLPLSRRLSLRFTKNIKEVMLIEEAVSSADGSIWADKEKDGEGKDFLVLHFEPTKRDLKDHSLTGRKRRFLTWFEQYKDFLDKWNRNDTLKHVDQVYGITNPRMGNFAVQKLGFHFDVEPGEQTEFSPSVVIHASRDMLLFRLRSSGGKYRFLNQE